MVGLIGLDDGAPRTIAAAGPADGLDEELVGPFGGALVGEVERDVGRDDPDQRHRRDVEALGDEARPDEDIEASLGEGIDDALGGTPMLHDVAVEPPDTQRREGLAHLALDPLACHRRGSGCAAMRRLDSATRAGSRGRSDGTAASSRPGGRRAAVRSPGRPGRARSRGTGRPTPCRAG